MDRKQRWHADVLRKDLEWALEHLKALEKSMGRDEDTPEIVPKNQLKLFDPDAKEEED